MSADLSYAQAQLFPIRKENNRLVRENHGLHLERVREVEVRQEEKQQQENIVQQLKGRVQDLELLLAAKDAAILNGEREAQRLKEVSACKLLNFAFIVFVFHFSCSYC